MYGLHYIPAKPGRGLRTTPWEIHTGSNSGYQAINLAYHFGAKKVILLGYDMQHTDGKLHWHGSDPSGMGNPTGIKGWVKNFGPLAEDLKALGVDVVNCTRETALECFRRSTLEAEL